MIDRRKSLGASEAPTVAKVNPHQSIAELWLIKTGRADPDPGNENTKRGLRLESALMEFAEEEIGELPDTIYRQVQIVHPNGLLHTTFDGLIGRDQPEASIEAKSTALSDEYGEEGTDQVPERVIVQAHHGFACVPTLKVCWVPVVMPGYRSFEWRMYRVDRNPDLVKAVEEMGIDFMRKHVMADVAPDDFRASLEVLKRVKRVPEKVIDLDTVELSIYQTMQAGNARVREMLSACEALKASIIGKLGDAEAGRFPDGSMITYMETKRKGYTVEPTTYRQLKFKKNGDLALEVARTEERRP